jgi:ElaB/YqjD/DUF883 family membrane-anchored ribosome-binding protein
MSKNKHLTSEEIKEEIYEDLSDIKHALADTSNAVKKLLGEKYNESVEKVTDYTSNKPFKSLAAAAAVGALLCLFLRK